MKTPLAVALVVVGGALIIAPIVADYFLKANHQANVVRLLEKPESRGVSMPHEEIGSTYSFGCWLVGALAIGASIYFSVRPHTGDLRADLKTSPVTPLAP